MKGRCTISALWAALSMLALSFGWCSCTTEDYETGDGKLSYLRADFVEVHTHAAKTLDYALSDDGDSLVFEPMASAEWATTPDSIYRALLMYNRKSDDRRVTDIISVSQVLTLWMVPASRVKTMHTDPVDVESAWLSRSGKYVNMGIYIKTGVTEGVDARQTVAMVCDTVMNGADDTREYHLRLYHDQNGVPQYYSSRIFLSVPIGMLRRGDAVIIEANTYKGLVTRRFTMGE